MQCLLELAGVVGRFRFAFCGRLVLVVRSGSNFGKSSASLDTTELKVIVRDECTDAMSYGTERKQKNSIDVK